MTASSYIANVTNRIKPKLDGENKKKVPHSNQLGSVKHYGGGGKDGSHNSSILNKLDPRVDSSRDDQARNEAFARNTYYYPKDGSTTTGSHDIPANKFGPL
ncbi:hypothetical protein PENFLA_c084G09666 [Penicillium flavigenum]|uniref:Uncharacterized protein n=1 Tax=Penicillium flavigenum TaxID=254877 RepID=A0A1V6S9S9_9EURO|nr:hypothetical protein PENFLA_c084G09666 [Penicillium flavigenum]